MVKDSLIVRRIDHLHGLGAVDRCACNAVFAMHPCLCDLSRGIVAWLLRHPQNHQSCKQHINNNYPPMNLSKTNVFYQIQGSFDYGTYSPLKWCMHTCKYVCPCTHYMIPTPRKVCHLRRRSSPRLPALDRPKADHTWLVWHGINVHVPIKGKQFSAINNKTMYFDHVCAYSELAATMNRTCTRHVCCHTILERAPYLSVCLYIYIYIYTYRERERYIYTHVYVYLSLSLYIYIHITISLSLYIYIYIYV